jgi:uncharacterized protein with HEPN domain
MIVEELKLLTDIKNAIENIDIHLDYKRDFTSYVSNITKQRAVERELEIIGEATNKLLKISPNIQISYSRIIIDLRNKLIHSYDNVNSIVIWKIIMVDIPTLHQEVNNLIDLKK